MGFLIVGECLVLVMVVYAVFYFLFYKMENDFGSMSPYECGFDPKSGTRTSFSYRFFLISILFLIFDVEISLLLPFPFLVGSVGAVMVFLNFILVLIVGLMYEYYEGSLEWLDIFVSKA